MSSFIIRELSGGQPRMIELTDRGLPFRPLTVTGKMRAEVTWYPGNPAATVQMLGSEETETTLTGRWSDKYLGDVNTPCVTLTRGRSVQALYSARDAADAMDELRRRGQLVEVTWEHLSRIGYISEFAQTWRWREDVEWSLSFQWTALEMPVRVPDAALNPPSVQQVSDEVANSVGSLADFALLDSPLWPQSALLSAVVSGNLVSFVEDAVVATAKSTLPLREAAAYVTAGKLAVADAERRVVATLAGVVTAAKVLYAPHDAAVQQLAGMVGTTVVVGMAVKALVWDRGVTRSARALTRLATLRLREIEAGVADSVQDVRTAMEGMDLRQVSQDVYGTPFEWRALMDYNGLTSSGLSAGQQVVVPRRNGRPGS